MKKKEPSLIDYAAYAFAGGFWWLSRTAPKQVSFAASKQLCHLLYLLLKSRRKISIENLRFLFPDASTEKLEEILINAFPNLSLFITEFCFLPDMNKDNVHSFVRFNNFERLKEAHETGKGVILAWAHYNNPEWMNAAISLKGLPVYSVIREVDNPLIDAMLDKARNATGVKTIKREKGAMEIIRKLREGNVVTIATDQNASSNGVFVKFMGKWAATVKSPAVVHLRTGAPIIPAYSVREKDGTHTAFILPEIRITPSGELKRDVYLITQAIADAQERFITKRPEFWLWLHRRWKTQPDERELSKISRLAQYKMDHSGAPCHPES